MQALNRFLPPLIVAAVIAAALPVVPAADDDPPAASSRTKKTTPKTPGPKTAQGQQTPPKGPLFGPNPGAKPPMPTDNVADDPAGEDAADPFGEPLPKTLQEWRSRLTAEQFQITRMKGTERAFTGKYWKTETPGTYKCVCCGEPLFTSDDKFVSECGWPAFSAPIDKKANGKVAETPDLTFGMRRIEVTCRKCGAHLGHVFNDGPPPTGIRYCINSASIVLDEAKPATGKDAGKDADTGAANDGDDAPTK